MLEKVGEGTWTCDGTTVPFYGMPYTTRMTVVVLPQNQLWVHSPERLSQSLVQELAGVVKVAYLISPNKLHHLFLPEWMERYPTARSYAAPGLIEKRKDLSFVKGLQDYAEDGWKGELDQIIFRGSPAMEEVVFFHKESKTLILTDLIENFPENHFKGWRKGMARAAGILAPNGRTPLDWRLSFVFGKKRARRALTRMIEWEPENIIISHGNCIFGGGRDFLVKSFRWLQSSA